jgi:hypothetical protein
MKDSYEAVRQSAEPSSSPWTVEDTGCISSDGGGEDVMRSGKGHAGVCRTVARFRDKQLEEMAASVESEYEGVFKPYGASVVVRPERISHFASVGEGIELALVPFEAKTWQHWGRFESDIEVSRRPRFSRVWRKTIPLDEVRVWLHAEAQKYLQSLTSLSH